jgi:hypothetical protein
LARAPLPRRTSLPFRLVAVTSSVTALQPPAFYQHHDAGRRPAAVRQTRASATRRGLRFAILGFALPLLLAKMKRMGSQQSERRKYDTDNCDAARGPGQ